MRRVVDGQQSVMVAVVAIVAVQLLFAVLLFGTLVLDRGDDEPRMAELRRRVR